MGSKELVYLLDYLCLFPTFSMSMCAYACSGLPYPKTICMPMDASSNHFDMPMYAVCPTPLLCMPIGASSKHFADPCPNANATIRPDSNNRECTMLVYFLFSGKANGFTTKAYIIDYLLIVYDCNIPGKYFNNNFQNKIWVNY